MLVDAWLPVGFVLPDGVRIRTAQFDGRDWQIFDTEAGGHALVVKASLAHRWLDTDLVEEGHLSGFSFGGDAYLEISSGPDDTLAPLDACKSPGAKSEALAFAEALRATRERDAESALQDAIYVEKLSRLLPTHSLSSRVSDDIVLGSWLAGGVPVSVTAFRRLRTLVGWLAEAHLREVVQRAGFAPPVLPRAATREGVDEKSDSGGGREAQENPPGSFTLAGRPELEGFLVEHVIDIVENEERYRALGIDFPSAIILHGPPGCGKTFAVERLVDYLGWPSFQIEASSVASPYIHETSKKVAEVFALAMTNAPSILVIDEMEAFLADRQAVAGGGHHRVEEVAEFLRRIPEAIKSRVLIVAMTNRIEMIDPAILRRGRFDHVVKVDMASEPEVLALLQTLVNDLPQAPGIEYAPLAKALAGRPLSDVSFVVREGARLAARAGKSILDQSCLLQALKASPARDPEDGKRRKIGFV